MISDPELIKKLVFVSNSYILSHIMQSKEMENMPLQSLTDTLGPNSIVVLNGDKWRRHRKLITPISNIYSNIPNEILPGIYSTETT